MKMKVMCLSSLSFMVPTIKNTMDASASSVAVKNALGKLMQLKPSYDPEPPTYTVSHNRKRCRRSDVCKEMLPKGVQQWWDEVRRWRREHGLPNSELTVLDLGSGIGGVILSLMILNAAHGDIINYFGVEKCSYFHSVMQQWLQQIRENSPRHVRNHITDMERNMICADFTSNEEVFAMISAADVIFCNNLLFDDVSKDHPTSLNGELSALLDFHMSKPGACVVTTCQLSCQHIHLRHHFKLLPGAVQWAAGQHADFTCYLSSR